jgi:hypothetical protein
MVKRLSPTAPAAAMSNAKIKTGKITSFFMTILL